jgi:hypothetical protein
MRENNAMTKSTTATRIPLSPNVQIGRLSSAERSTGQLSSVRGDVPRPGRVACVARCPALEQSQSASPLTEASLEPVARNGDIG